MFSTAQKEDSYGTFVQKIGSNDAWCCIRSKTQRSTLVRTQLETYFSLLQIKATFQESQAIFFDNNEICFYLQEASYHSLEIGSLCSYGNTFGPFGKTDALYLLRSMRNICLVLNLGNYRAVFANVLRLKVQLFVYELTSHMDDYEKKALLKHPKIGVARDSVDYTYDHDDEQNRRYIARSPEQDFGGVEPVEYYMYAFEGLTELQKVGSIRTIKTSGLPPWFAQVLEVCISGEGGEISYADESHHNLESEQNSDMRSLIITNQKVQPIYAWKSFAERNGIEVPEESCAIWDLK